jgi:hypothetical protein
MRQNGTVPGFNRDPTAPIDNSWDWNEQKDTHTVDSPVGALTPVFTWHGGQFVQVHAEQGVSFDGKLNALVGLVMHSNLTQTGELKFSGGEEAKALNALQGIILHSQTSNVAAGTPTDCPTREKHGEGAFAHQESTALYFSRSLCLLTAATVVGAQDGSATRRLPLKRPCKTLIWSPYTRNFLI